MTQVTDTPKATLTVSKLGYGVGKDNVSGGITNTLKLKRDKLTASVAFSDKSIHPPGCKAFTDVVAQVDIKHKVLTANTKYEAGPKKYTVGATWEPKVSDGLTVLKGWYSNKDKLVNGEATIVLNKSQKALISFNQKKVLSAKYTAVKNSWTVEPTYNFAKESLAVAVTKKIKGKDTLKVSYDLKSEAAAAEWNHKPFKLTLSTSVSKKVLPTVSKPTLSAVYENVFEF